MNRILEGRKQAYGNGLDASIKQSCYRSFNCLLVKRHDYVAARVNPLFDLDNVVRLHQLWRGDLDLQVQGVLPRRARDAQRIPEPPRRYEPDTPAIHLRDDVGHDGCAVGELGHAGQHALDGNAKMLVRRGSETVQHALRPVARGGERLLSKNAACAVDQREVGEGAADIHTDVQSSLCGRHTVPSMEQNIPILLTLFHFATNNL